MARAWWAAAGDTAGALRLGRVWHAASDRLRALCTVAAAAPDRLPEHYLTAYASALGADLRPLPRNVHTRTLAAARAARLCHLVAKRACASALVGRAAGSAEYAAVLWQLGYVAGRLRGRAALPGG